MKKSFTLLIVFVLTILTTQAQEANSYISTMRMGIFKLKTNKNDIEKLINKKINFTYKDNGFLDTFKVTVQNAAYILSFNKKYNENEKAPAVYELYAVSSSNTTLKTKSGVGINNTKATLLATYDKNDIAIANDWNFKEKGNTKDKIQFITINDFDAATTLIFTTENRVVTSIEIKVYEGE